MLLFAVCLRYKLQSNVSTIIWHIIAAPPFWRNKPPEDVNTSDEEDALFNCYANGNPRPDIAWSISGIPVAGEIFKLRFVCVVGCSLIMCVVNFIFDFFFIIWIVCQLYLVTPDFRYNVTW